MKRKNSINFWRQLRYECHACHETKNKKIIVCKLIFFKATSILN